MINICYCVHIKRYSYLYLLASSISSILNNTKECVVINIFHNASFIDEYKTKFTELVAKYGQKIKFYFVDETKFKELSLIEKIVPKYQIDVYSISSFYRLLIWNFLDENVEKYIYLDVDTIVNLDISTLFNEQLGDYPLGAIPEFELNHREVVELYNALLVKHNIIPMEKYFNTGIMLFNLKKFKQEYTNFLSYSLERYNKFNGHLPDQDLLNIYFYDNYKHLELKYNTFVRIERSLNIYEINNCIYHYVGSSLFKNKFCDMYDELFLDNFSRTNFFNYIMIKNLIGSFNKVYVETRSNFINILNCFRKINIVIFFDLAYENFVKKNFNNIPALKIKVKGKILLLNNILDFLKKSKETTIIFFTDHYKIIKSNLIKRRIIEDKNCIDGLEIVGKHDEKINQILTNIFYN